MTLLKPVDVHDITDIQVLFTLFFIYVVREGLIGRISFLRPFFVLKLYISTLWVIKHDTLLFL